MSSAIGSGLPGGGPLGTAEADGGDEGGGELGIGGGADPGGLKLEGRPLKGAGLDESD